MFLYLFLYCVLLLFIKFTLRCCGDCAFSASSVRECTDVSHVAGEGVELTVHKDSAVVEEIKEVELRSRLAQFIAPAGFRPRGRNPRRHPNVPRVKKKYRITVSICEAFPI